MNIFHILNLLFLKLTKRQKRYTYFAVLVMIISGLFEIFYIASFLPFISLITNSESSFNNHIFKNFALIIGFGKDELLIFYTSLFVLTVLISSAISIFNIYLTGRVCAKIGTEISTECYKRTIYQDYSFHIKNDKNEMTQNSSFRIARTIATLNLILQTISSSIICIFIISSLIVISGKISIILALTYILIYYFIKSLVSSRQFSNGKIINKLNTKQLKKLLESLNSIKEILVNNNQNKYIESYARRDRKLRYREAEVKVISLAPKFILQGLGIISISITAFILNSNDNSAGIDVIPVLGTIALGTQRLLPAFQSIFKSWAGIKSNLTHVKGLIDALNLPLSSFEIQKEIREFNFTDRIEFSDVCFRHENDSSYIIENLDLVIHKGEKIGLIGKTGSGKSTLTDLLMGLIKPTSGSIKIDGKSIFDPKEPSRLLAWRRNISHLPQDIFLFDDSIKANITASSNSSKVDNELIEEVCEVAQIKDLLVNLPRGLDTIVGDNGIRLSGGQKQRIGIARALYKRHNLLIFDEGTSALDNLTESKVIESIYKFNKNITIIIIAHRLSSINKCNRIIELEDGKIKT